MGRKFGKKNVVKIDPLAYNIGLIGESGIGKTSLAKEVCEKLVGEDGYVLLNIGKEDGIDAVAGAVYEDVPDWDTFEEIVEDIIENKTTDYKDLKVLVYDTIDELIRITEPEVVRLHNKEYPDKQVKSIKAAFGGYMKGEDKAMELILDKIWELKQVGVSFFLIGHTKKRTMTDPISEVEYDMLTTNIQHRYFNAIKTKLHVLGVASIDREFVIEKKKNKKDESDKGKIQDESRVITFRDDNFNIDSKSRFSEIIDKIPLDRDEFIKALEDAIKAEHEKQKNAKSIEETKKEQEEQKEKEVKENAKKKQGEIKEKKDKELKNELIQEFRELMNNMKEDKEKLSKVTKKMKENDISAKEIESADIDKLQELIKFAKEL